MDKREKVIKGLECHMSMLACDKCPYYCDDTCSGIDDVVYDALALLKAQEAVEPVIHCKNADLSNGAGFACSGCGGSFLHKAVNYCPNCGRAVKWDG